MLLFVNEDNVKPIKFYPYPHSVLDRIHQEDYYENPDVKYLREEIVELFKNNGFKGNFIDNKVVFEIEVYGKRIFYGFHDWIFSVGFRVHQLP